MNATLTPLPLRPVRPAAYNELVLLNNAAVAAARAAARGYVRGKVTWAQLAAANAEAHSWQELCAQWWGTPEGVEYRAVVDAYEVARTTRKAETAALAQASVNRQAASAVRRAACPLCFATHRGEC